MESCYQNIGKDIWLFLIAFLDIDDLATLTSICWFFAWLSLDARFPVHRQFSFPMWDPEASIHQILVVLYRF
jgi:hypothetical protein